MLLVFSGANSAQSCAETGGGGYNTPGKSKSGGCTKACTWASDAVDPFFVSLIFKFLVSFYITPYFDVTADKSL